MYDALLVMQHAANAFEVSQLTPTIVAMVSVDDTYLKARIEYVVLHSPEGCAPCMLPCSTCGVRISDAVCQA